MALPWAVKMAPLADSRSARSMPALRGMAPTSSTKLTPSNARSASAVGTVPDSSGKAQSSSSMHTPSSASTAWGISRRCRITGWSSPNI
jgi:hypothetical protein